MKSKNILLIDDEQDLRDLVKENLHYYGFKNIQTAKNADEALKILRTGSTDLILLDVMMPKMDGFELLEIIRSFSKVPVIMLTAKGEDEDRIKGLEYGADDYIVKPFLIRELILRIKAVLRRSYPDLSNIVELPFASINLDSAEVIRKDKKQYTLTAKELAIFKKLVENNNAIVSISSLCQNIIGEFYEGYESTLMTHIRHLREKIEKDPSSPKSLITVRGLGYKLIVGD